MIYAKIDVEVDENLSNNYSDTLDVTVYSNSSISMELNDEVNIKFGVDILKQKAQREPDKAIWQLQIGTLKQELDQDAEALEAYERALALEPDNPETLNNLAWLLITASNPAAHDPDRALFLASQASSLRPTAGHILDTLAATYWANEMLKEALEAENKAIRHDPANHIFYKRQMNFFLNNSWPADLEGWIKEKQS